MAKNKLRLFSLGGQHEKKRSLDSKLTSAIATGIFVTAATIYLLSTDEQTRQVHREKAADMADRALGFLDRQTGRLERAGLSTARLTRASNMGHAVVASMLRPQSPTPESAQTTPAGPGEAPFVPLPEEPQSSGRHAVIPGQRQGEPLPAPAAYV